MTDTDVQTNTAPETEAPQTEAPASTGGFQRGSRNRNERGGRGRQGGGRRPQRTERTRPEFDQKMISIRRVARVTSGGRRFNFSVALVAGDKRGRVGVGTGKAGDTSLAIEKAFRNAKKNMVTVRLGKESSIPHDVESKYASAIVKIMPAPGRGLVAGSSVRTVLEFAGVTNVTAKILSRSKNQLNNARAAVKALGRLRN